MSGVFRPYSVRAVGVPKAFCFEFIMSAVGWRQESMFHTFYNMPIASQGVFVAVVASVWCCFVLSCGAVLLLLHCCTWDVFPFVPQFVC